MAGGIYRDASQCYIQFKKMNIKSLKWDAEPAADYGAGPLWHPTEKKIYWSDVVSCKLYRYDPATNHTDVVLDDGRPIGALTLQEDDSLLLFRDQANVVVWWDGAISKTIINSIADFRHTHFTAAVAAADGRVFCATRSDKSHPGRLLSLDQDGHLALVADIFGKPAGMRFSPSSDFFYFNDAHSTHLMTWRFSYDSECGFLSHQVVFQDFTRADDSGAPTGMAVDSEGCIWLSLWDGGALLRCDYQGNILQKISLPVKKPTDICFGGEEMDILFAASAGGHRRPLDGLYAGSLGQIKIEGVRGEPLKRSRIQL